MKVSLFLRLFLAGEILPCAAAHVEVEKTPNSIAFCNDDLRTFDCAVEFPGNRSALSWQLVGDAIFAACQSEHDTSCRIPVGGDYEITWRKV